MKQISMILFLLLWPLSDCQETMDISKLCRECASAPCPINVGLLAGLTGAEETALRQALIVINSKTFLHPNWEIRLTSLGRDNQELFQDSTGHKPLNVLINQLQSSKLSVLIGPESNVAVERIHPLLVMLNITHIAPLASNPTFLDPGRFPNLIRMVPDDNYQLQAIISLLDYYHYKEMSLLTSDDEYGLSMMETLRRQFHYRKEYLLRKIVMLRIPLNKTEIRFNLQQINKYKPHFVVLATDRRLGHEILTEAYRLNMTTSRVWLWLAMDVMTSMPIEMIRTNGKSLLFRELLGLRPRIDTQKIHEQLNLTHLTKISFTVERYIDSFLLVADRIKQTCKETTEKASNYIPYFDNLHSTRPVIYDIMHSKDTDWSNIGQWSSDQKSSLKQLNMEKSSCSIRPSNRLRVTTNLEHPFVYFENSNETDPSKLRGFCIDMLKELSRLADFEYDIHLVKDELWGVIDKNGKWDGMIGEVMRGEADLSLSALYVTQKRLEVVDFLPSFLKQEYKLLIKRSLKANEEYNAFSFLDPFDISLYRAILISVFSLAVFVSFLSIVSPYGIRGSFFQTEQADAAKRAGARTKSVGLFIPKKTKKEKKLLREREEAERGMGLNNSLYLFWATLFSQSPERVPRSTSAKVVALTWYVASTVFVASYTANLVTSVSGFTQEVDFIQSTEDLLMQTIVQFGTEKGNAIEAQLLISKTNLVKKLYTAINSNKSTMGYWVTNKTQAYELVRAGKFAMIYDSLTLDLMAVESDCELKTVSLGFGNIQYAIAVPKSSEHLNFLSVHMQAMEENGFLQILLEKYFVNLDACNHLDITKMRSRQLTFTDLAGVFILVGVVIIGGLVVLGIEWIVAALADIKSLRPNAPKTLREALRIRRNRLSMDIDENWFPLEQMIEKWKTPLLPVKQLAGQIEKWTKLRTAANLIPMTIRRKFSQRSVDIIHPVDENSVPTLSSESAKNDKRASLSSKFCFR